MDARLRAFERKALVPAEPFGPEDLESIVSFLTPDIWYFFIDKMQSK